MLNEIIGTAARFEQLLTRKFGLAGGAPSPQLTPEITPIFEIEGGPEGRILAGEQLAGAVAQASTGVATRSYVALSNPVNSGLVAVVTDLYLWSDALGLITVGFTTGTPPAANITPRQRDGRKIGGPTMQVRQGSDFATDFPGTVTIFGCVVGANVSSLLGPVDVIVAPNNSLVIAHPAVNKQLTVSMLWREVPLARGEAGPF